MKAIEVVDDSNLEVVHEVDVTGKREAQVEKTERGLLLVIDTDRFFTRVVEK